MNFTKYDDLKSRLDLLPSDALELVGFVSRHGALKYAPGNWRKCKDSGRYVAPMLRHIFKHLKGDYTDKESGLLHLAHAICSGLFALDLFVRECHNPKMEKKQFSYFALVKRKTKHRGVVQKRFRSYEKAWTYLTDEGLEPKDNLIMTVTPADKVGQSVRI